MPEGVKGEPSSQLTSSDFCQTPEWRIYAPPIPASTGPRSRGRGWPRRQSQVFARASSFNGAALTGARMGDLNRGLFGASARFNGAALTGARMVRRNTCAWPMPTMLQRGRAHGGADGRHGNLSTPHRNDASTGPRSRGRGWENDAGHIVGRRVFASTGPRSRGRGWNLRAWLATPNTRASTGPRSRGRGWLERRVMG